MLEKIFLKNDNYKILDYKENDGKIDVYIKSKVSSCQCPKCHQESNIWHSTYIRNIQDTPIHNTQTWLHVSCYEFECKNPKCSIKTFTEELPFARKNKVKTDALIQLILSVSMFLSSTCASLVLSFIGVNISADSIDNIIKNIKVTDNLDVEEVGIDDIATRKGITYATAIYDMKDHHLLALLDGRDADSIKEWLENHKKIKVIARDRASAYAAAISEILPECMQVADRFHLFQNLIKYLKDMFYSEVPNKIFIQDNQIVDSKSIKKIPIRFDAKLNTQENKLNELNYDNSKPVDIFGNEIIFDSKRHHINSKQYKEQEKNRRKKYEIVKELRELLKNCNNKSRDDIASQFNISRSLLRKYENMTDEEVENILVRKECKKRKTVMDDYVNIIYKMIIDNVPVEYIVAYLVKKGYKGKLHNIKARIIDIVKNNNLSYNYSKLVFVEYKYPEDVIIITRHELLKYILTIDEKKKNINIDKYIDIIIDKYPIAKTVKEIWINFHNTMFGENTDSLDIFIQRYEKTLTSFCNGLKKDITPIKNAISYTINSGFVEGNNNKFKLIKRIVYGKQKLVNLFKKSYLCFLATTENFNIEDIVECVLQES